MLPAEVDLPADGARVRRSDEILIHVQRTKRRSNRINNELLWYGISKYGTISLRIVYSVVCCACMCALAGSGASGNERNTQADSASVNMAVSVAPPAACAVLRQPRSYVYGGRAAAVEEKKRNTKNEAKRDYHRGKDVRYITRGFGHGRITVVPPRPRRQRGNTTLEVLFCHVYTYH